MTILYEYPKCTTCRKAKKYLSDHNIDFESHDMVKTPPSASTLKNIVVQSDDSIDDFFNKRGKKYKDLDLKDRLQGMSDDEKLELLSSDGMLIKRPLLVMDETVILGFKESSYEAVK